MPTEITAPRIRRLGPGDREIARHLFDVMAQVFEEPSAPLSDGYDDRLLERADFWVIAAFDDRDEIMGGLTAHTLPMTRAEISEIFIYDIAVRTDCQRRGVGRQLMQALRAQAAGVGVSDLFVPADNDDTHALDFYRTLGGAPAAVTIFSFGDPQP